MLGEVSGLPREEKHAHSVHLVGEGGGQPLPPEVPWEHLGQLREGPSGGVTRKLICAS